MRADFHDIGRESEAAHDADGVRFDVPDTLAAVRARPAHLEAHVRIDPLDLRNHAFRLDDRVAVVDRGRRVMSERRRREQRQGTQCCDYPHWSFSLRAACHDGLPPQYDRRSIRLLRGITNMAVRHEVRAAALAAWLVAGSLLCTGVAAQSAASCDDACLKGFVDGYIDALAHRDATKLAVANDVKYTENGRVLDLGEGFWRTAGAPLRYRDYVLDPGTGGGRVHGAERVRRHRGNVRAAEDRERQDHGDRNVRRARRRSALVRAAEPRAYVRPLRADGRRRAATREQLVAAATAYFDAIQTEGTPQFKQAPFAPGMKRFENGLQTTNVT